MSCDCQNEERTPPAIHGRRKALLWIGSGFMAIGSVIAALPILGFVLAPFQRKMPNEWVDLGDVSGFPAGETRLATFTNPIRTPWDGDADTIPCWVRHVEKEQFQIFAINCTHLGCPVRWFQESKLFMCPCHGGVYDQDGARVSGPPPRGLYTYEHRITGGRLEIRAGRLPTLQESA